MHKIAIVGTGIIGIEHIKAICELDNCSICALCDLNEERLKELAAQYSVPYFTDYTEIPKKTDADAVIINLPHFLHCESTVFFLKSGLHVLIEKPMANTVQECDIMLEAAKKSGKKLAVGHVQRFFNSTQKVKEYVDNKTLGELCMVCERRTISYFNELRPKWFLQKDKSGGGIIMNYGAHALDRLFYITGACVSSALAFFSNEKTDDNVEGHAQVLFGLDNGCSATVTLCGYTYSGYDVTYYFTNGVLRLDGGSLLLYNADGTWHKVLEAEDNLAMQRQIIEFCKYIEGKPSNIADGEYGKDVISVIEKIYAQ